MIALVGGSGSTGSSLLKNILNRHPQIFAGEESNLFCKKQLYTDFQTYKYSILKRGIKGLKNHGWHIYSGVDLFTPEYHLTPAILEALISKSNSFNQLAATIHQHIDPNSESITWIEKTPANSANFRYFLASFPNQKVIHLVRNPLDTIASLVARGYDLYYASGIYLFNTAAALSVKENPNCLTISYENLVAQPTDTLKKTCQFLGIDFQASMLESNQENIPVSQLEGWNYDETANIGQKSVGRFTKSSPELQEQILTAINCLEVNKAGAKRYALKYNNIPELAENMGYQFPAFQPGSTKTLQKARTKDRLQRLSRLYPTGFDYPLDIR